MVRRTRRQEPRPCRPGSWSAVERRGIASAGQLRGGLVLVAIALLLANSSRSTAQTLGQLQLTFAPFQRELPKSDPTFNAFWEGLTLLSTEENLQRTMKGGISVGFSGDEAEGNSLFKFKTSASLTRGTYPAELKFATDLSLQVKGTDFQEDVTRFTASYDYHVSTHVECYAFFERFTDSFMDIQQRYETGAGMEFGANLLKTKKHGAKDGRDDIRKKLDAFTDALPKVKAVIEALPDVPPAGRTKPAASDYTLLEQDLGRYRRAFDVRESHLYVGTAFSVFGELEQAKITASVAVPSATATTSTQAFTLPAVHRYRLTVRPTVVARVSEDLTVGIYPYFKLPLDGPRSEMVDGARRLDYRADLLNWIAWDIAKTTTGNEQIGFLIKVDYHFDNVPPRIGQDVIDAQAAAGHILTGTVAPKSHTAASMQLDIKWGK